MAAVTGGVAKMNFRAALVSALLLLASTVTHPAAAQPVAAEARQCSMVTTTGSDVTQFFTDAFVVNPSEWPEISRRWEAWVFYVLATTYSANCHVTSSQLFDGNSAPNMRGGTTTYRRLNMPARWWELPPDQVAAAARRHGLTRGPAGPPADAGGIVLAPAETPNQRNDRLTREATEREQAAATARAFAARAAANATADARSRAELQVAIQETQQALARARARYEICRANPGSCRTTAGSRVRRE